MRTRTIACIIISISVILAYASVWNDSIIVDEDPHIGAGYSYLVKQDMRLNPEHPPLAKDLAAIPLLFLNLKQGAFQGKAWTNDVNGQWEFGRSLIFGTGNNADLIAHWAKIPMLLLFVLAAWIAFRWTQKRYGDRAGIIALILFCFSPTIMAHARFVTNDVPALFGVLLATYYFLHYLKESNRWNGFLAALALGVGLLAKFSTFLLLPFFLILALAWGWSEAGIHGRWIASVRYGLRSIVIIIAAFVVVIWPVYLFHTWHYPPERQRADTEHILASQGDTIPVRIVEWVSDKPILRAIGQYGLGLLMVNQRASGGNTTYFFSEVRVTAWKSYFPIVYFIKEPLAWWGIVIIALCAMILKLRTHSLKLQVLRSKIREHFDEFAMLLLLAIYWFVSIRGNLNIGVRHLLPVYGFTIILVSGQLTKALRLYSSIALKLFVLGLLVWYVAENVRVYPYYLTYFNQTVGGPSGGYRYVVDSNLDWGQDLKRFSNWVKQNDINKIELDYFGWADQAYYLKDRFLWMTSSKYKDAEDFKARNTSDGWLAVSATFLQNSSGTNYDPHNNGAGRYAWLSAYQPVTVIGNSIFIYQIK